MATVFMSPWLETMSLWESVTYSNLEDGGDLDDCNESNDPSYTVIGRILQQQFISPFMLIILSSPCAT
jgi:hypothetical protein